MASHEPSGSVIKTHNAFSSVSPHLKTPKPNTSQQTAKAENNPEPNVEIRPSREEMLKKGLCFNCLEKGHTSKACPKPKNNKSDKRPTHVSTCAVSPAVPLSVQLSQEPVTKDSSSNSDCVDDDECIIDETDENNSAQNTFDVVSSCIDADEFHIRSYVDIAIEGLPRQTALIDGGSEICCISETLIQQLNAPVVKQLRLSGLSKQSDLVNVVRLHVKPVAGEKHMVNIAPSVRVWFAVVPGLHETVILTPNVVSLLQNVARYNLLDPSTSAEVEDNAEAEAKAADTVEEISVDTVTHDTHKPPDNMSVTLEHSDRVSTPTQTNVVVADTHR